MCDVDLESQKSRDLALCNGMPRAVFMHVLVCKERFDLGFARTLRVFLDEHATAGRISPWRDHPGNYEVGYFDCVFRGERLCRAVPARQEPAVAHRLCRVGAEWCAHAGYVM
jgi:hypothetical protein